jgi:hypothetical protein
VSDGDSYGEMIVINDNILTRDSLYYFNSSSTWSLTNATNTGGGSKQLLGIATTSDGTRSPLLIRGFFKNTAWSFTVGNILYMSTTNGGITENAPSTSGNIVRIVGYALATDEIYFNPSYDWIELA